MATLLYSDDGCGEKATEDLTRENAEILNHRLPPFYNDAEKKMCAVKWLKRVGMLGWVSAALLASALFCQAGGRVPRGRCSDHRGTEGRAPGPAGEV